LETDQDFANAEATVKYCKDAEDRLDLVKKQALAQTASIDDVFRVMDGLKEQLRSTRLALDKQVKARKESIRAGLIAEFHRQLVEHVNGLNDGNGAQWQAYPPPAVLGDAIKGLKSIASCRNALAAKCSELRTELTRAACRLARNREMLKHEDRDWYSVFPDFAMVGSKDAEDFDALAELRIRKVREAEAAALAQAQAKAEAERAAAAAADHAADANKMIQPDTAPVEVTQPPAAEPVTPPPATEQPPEVGMSLADLYEVNAFLKERDFGNQHSHVRSILVEFCKFVERRRSRGAPKVAA
jgi:prophage DNA circulation protein